MALSEGVQASLRYKAYASGALSATAESDPTTAPGASGGQLLRRVTHTLNLRKNTFQSNEIRSDRQIGDFRHGNRRVEGSISGELSPGTYFDLIEAAMRGTKATALAKSNTEFTSCAADNATSKFTFAGGDPVSEGFRVGDVIRFTNLSEASNNSKNFTILSFGGTSNREVTVSPAPTSHSADTSFNVARPGRTIAVPSSSFVSRLFAFEDHDEATDISRLFTECRVTGFGLRMPAEGMDTIDIPVMGRGQTVYSAGSAPFFASPTAITSSGVTAGANGLVQVGGTTVGVITDIALSFAMTADAPSVRGQLFPPEIFLGRAVVTGTLSALFENATFLENFTDEDEISLLVRADAGGGDAPECISIYLPRVKLGGADVSRSGDGAQALNLPFQALRYLGAGAGIETTTIRIHDTAAS